MAGASDTALQGSPELFAEKVARRKRMILRTLGAFDPRLVRLIDEKRFQAQGARRRARVEFSSTRPWDRYRLLLLKAGYAASVLPILFLIYLSHVQSP